MSSPGMSSPRSSFCPQLRNLFCLAPGKLRRVFDIACLRNQDDMFGDIGCVVRDAFEVFGYENRIDFL